LLQIVNQKDPNWWQAKKVGSNGSAGLISSQELEERRKAFVKPEADYVHKISICGTRVCYRYIVLSYSRDSLGTVKVRDTYIFVTGEKFYTIFYLNLVCTGD